MRKVMSRVRQWFKRRGLARRRLPRREFAPVEEIVEQGMLVADVAVRMSVKNEIIMNALKRSVDYDVHEVEELVSHTLLELAREREQDARHISRVLDEVRGYGRSAWKETEYGGEDSETLRHRQQVYSSISEQLRALRDDPEYVKTTAEEAREAAWREVGDSLKERATHPYYAGGASPEYREARENRIQTFIERDLTQLIEQQAVAKKGGILRRKTEKNEQKSV